MDLAINLLIKMKIYTFFVFSIYLLNAKLVNNQVISFYQVTYETSLIISKKFSCRPNSYYLWIPFWRKIIAQLRSPYIFPIKLKDTIFWNRIVIKIADIRNFSQYVVKFHGKLTRTCLRIIILFENLINQNMILDIVLVNQISHHHS